MPMILLVYKKTYFNTNKIDPCFLVFVFFLLQNYKEIFPDKVPSRLPPIKRIEHQIDFIPGVIIPN
jgi:hypothetical protein